MDEKVKSYMDTCDLLQNTIDLKDDELLFDFYHHHLDYYLLEPIASKHIKEIDPLCERLLNLINLRCVSELLEIVRKEFVYYPISKQNIPQFSSFDDAYYKVPYYLKYSGIDGVDFSRMGYMLRTKKRSIVADKKYGENHLKTSLILGLCTKISKAGYFLSRFGNAFLDLSDEEKEHLKPRLSLYIPLVQNIVMSSDPECKMMEELSILSNLTATRRLPNVRKLVDIVLEGVV